MRDYNVRLELAAAARNMDALDSRLSKLQQKAHNLGFTIEETHVKGCESRGRQSRAGSTAGGRGNTSAAARGASTPAEFS